MDFRVYVVVEVPLIEKEYELLLPIDRRIHDVLKIFRKSFPELSEGYYAKNEFYLYNKSTGKMYDMNVIIKNSDIKTGTRLVLA